MLLSDFIKITDTHIKTRNLRRNFLENEDFY